MSNGIRITPKVRLQHKAQVIRDLTNVARIYAEEALENVITIMRKSDDENVRLKAAQLIIERAYGKPRQDVQSADATDAVRKVMEIEFLSARQDTQDEVDGSQA
jgi:hypothetical protein